MTAARTDDELRGLLAKARCYLDYEATLGDRRQTAGWALEDFDTATTQLLDERAALAKDAARYRWLRSQDIGAVYLEAILFETISDDYNPPYRSLKHTGNLDAAIDAALQAQGEGHE